MEDEEKIRLIFELLNSLERKNVENAKNEILSLDKPRATNLIFMLLQDAAKNDSKKGLTTPRIELVKLALIVCFLDIEKVAGLISEKNLKNQNTKLVKSAFLIALKYYIEYNNKVTFSIIAALGSYFADVDSYNSRIHYTIREIIKKIVDSGEEIPHHFYLSISRGLVDNYVSLLNEEKNSEKEIRVSHIISILKTLLIPLKKGYLLPARDANDIPLVLESIKLTYRLGNAFNNAEIKDLSAQVIAMAGKNGHNIFPYFYLLPHCAATTSRVEIRKACLESMEILITKVDSIEALNSLKAKIQLAHDFRIEMTNKIVSNATKLGLRIRLKDPIILKLDSLLELLDQRKELFSSKDILLNDKIKPPKNADSSICGNKNTKLRAL